MTRAEAIERINARQNAMNLFTNIGEDEIQQEMNGATLRDVRNWIMNNWRRDDRPTEIERREYSDNHRLIKYSDGTSYEYIKKDIRSDLQLRTIILDGCRTFKGVFKYCNFDWKFIA